MIREFSQWFSGCSKSEVASILNFEHEEPLACYNIDEMSLNSLVDAPWPLRWLLTRYNRKHIFCSRRFIEDVELVPYLQQFKNKLRWRHVLGGAVPDRPNDVVRLRHKSTRPCNKVVLPGVSAFISRCRARVLEAALAAGRRTVCTRVSNMPFVVKYGLKLIEELKLVAVPNDKEPGFTVEHISTHLKSLERILSRPCYREVGWVNEPMVRLQYCHVCGIVAKIWCSSQCNVGSEPDTNQQLALVKLFASSLDIDKAVIAAEVITTMKSHKVEGKVVHRNIHAAGKYMFAGLSCWAGAVISKTLAEQAPWIIESREQFVATIRGLSTEPGDSMWRLDVAEFFMSGNAETLSATTCNAFQKPGQREAIKYAIEFLLDHQWVKSKFLGESRRWHVTKGSGMGLPHSGAVADACFWSLCEDGFIINNKQYLEGCGVKLYLRFKDDIWIWARAASGERRCARFITELMERAKITYTVELVDMSHHRVDFLSVGVSFKNGAFETKPVLKVSGTPLSCTSAHASSVKAWPVTYLKNLAGLCSDESVYETVKKEFVKTFINMSSPSFVSVLNSVEYEQCMAKRVKSERHSRGHGSDAAVMWLVLPYHPAFEKAGMTSRINDVLKEPEWQRIAANLGIGRIRVSWKNSLQRRWRAG